MVTREAERPGLGEAAKLVADRMSTIVRLELELASAEVKRKVAALGIGIGLVIGAAFFVLLAVALAVASVVAAVALTLPVWASLLVVTGGALLLAGLLAGIGIAAIRRGTPPVPVQAIEEARLTTEALKQNGSH